MSAKAKVKGCTHVSSVRAKQTSKRDTDAPAGPKKKGGTTMSEVHLPHQHSDEGTMRELQESVETIGSFQTVADVFKQLSDSSRVRIFWLLCHCEECVIDLSVAAVPLRGVRHRPLRDGRHELARGVAPFEAAA